MVCGWKKLRFWLILLTAILVMPVFISAEGQTDEVTIGVVAAMRRMLSLTDIQVKQIVGVVGEYVKETERLKAGKPDGEVLQRKMKSLREGMDSELEHYLTQDQMAVWKGQEEPVPRENDRVVPVGERHVPTRTLKDISTAKPHLQDDNGVLESGSEHKTSGIW